MLKISEFFKRIQGKQSKEIFIIGSVQSVINKHIGCLIPRESILLKSSVIVLNNIPQSARSAIFIKKQNIISDINKQQAIRTISDIK